MFRRAYAAMRGREDWKTNIAYTQRMRELCHCRQIEKEEGKDEEKGVEKNETKSW